MQDTPPMDDLVDAMIDAAENWPDRMADQHASQIRHLTASLESPDEMEAIQRANPDTDMAAQLRHVIKTTQATRALILQIIAAKSEGDMPLADRLKAQLRDLTEQDLKDEQHTR